jgi:hypothetical protein
LRVIPILTDDVALPAEADLPADIAGLSRRQYVPLRRRYTSVDLAYLVERITEWLARPASATARRRDRLKLFIAKAFELNEGRYGYRRNRCPAAAASRTARNGS